jgi:23S rRNA (uracil1939-C5)-methyltransferase
MLAGVEATSLDDAGRGVCVGLDGAVVRVADLLPGEAAEVAIEHRSPHRAEAWGTVARRLSAPSPDRVAPACPAFGRCGGCAWQHVAYPAQLRYKRDRVTAALAGDGAAVAEVVPSPTTLGYRNKGKYVVGGAAGAVVLGAYAPRSHAVVDTLGCRVVAPGVDAVARAVKAAVDRAALVPYDERGRRGELRYVVVREGDGGEVLVVLVTTTTVDPAQLARVAAEVGEVGAVAGVVAAAHDRRDAAILPADAPRRVLHGRGWVIERMAGVAVEVGAVEFAQVHRAQAARLYARVAELARPARRAVDLYTGLGGVALHLAAAGIAVTAVDVDADSIAALQRAANTAGLLVAAHVADAAAVDAQVLGGGIDVAVVDPPRKGLGAAGCARLAAIGAPTIVYVSCGVDSLARDLAVLRGAGYVADVVQPFDLMPGTAQVETVVRLKRRATLAT